MAKSRKQLSGHGTVTIVSIVTAICLLGDSMLYVVLPIYWMDVGLMSLWEVGILLSINRFVRLPLNPLIGWLYHRMSLRTGLLVAVLLGTLTTIGYGVFNGFVLWLILRMVWGIAWSFIRMGAFFSVIEFSDDTNRGHTMGRYNGISRLGSLFGMMLGGILVPFIGIKVVALAIGSLSFVALILVYLFMPEGQKSNAEQPKLPQGEIWKKLRSGPVIMLLLNAVLISVLMSALNTTLGLVIEGNYGKEFTVMGIVLGSTALSGALLAGRNVWDFFLAPWIGRKSDGAKGRIPLLMLSLISSAILYAVVPVDIPLFIWIIVVLIIMILGTALTTLVDATASDIAKSSLVVVVMTSYSIATDLGAALGPILSMWLLEKYNSMHQIYWACSAIFILIAAAFYFSTYSRPSKLWYNKSEAS